MVTPHGGDVVCRNRMNQAFIVIDRQGGILDRNGYVIVPTVFATKTDAVGTVSNVVTTKSGDLR